VAGQAPASGDGGNASPKFGGSPQDDGREQVQQEEHARTEPQARDIGRRWSSDGEWRRRSDDGTRRRKEPSRAF
jgi:hypothetical protein